MSSNHRTVLVVDDSAFMRQVIAEIIEGSGEFRVAGTARNGLDAIEKIGLLNPDIVTLDVDMPELDGLQTLGYIMSEIPRPVVMLSGAEAQTGVDPVIRALELGAVDFVRKPSGPISLDLDVVRERLLDALRAAAIVNLGGIAILARAVVVEAEPPPAAYGAATRVVCIAASTGGPRALADVVPRLPAGFDAAVLVVQHMPAGFTGSLARRLDGMSHALVTEAVDGEPLLHGRVYIAPGGRHMRLRSGALGQSIAIEDGPTMWGVRPAADPLFLDAAAAFGSETIAVVLTGMGRDAADGVRAVLDAGGEALAQDKATSIIYGMPHAAITIGGARRVLPIQEIPAVLVELVGARRAIR